MAFLKFVVECNLPFSVIQKALFSKLSTTVAGKGVPIPSTKVFMKFLKEVFDEMKKKLTVLISKQDYICVTCDVWSSQAQSYLGMTVHFYNDELELQSFVLA